MRVHTKENQQKLVTRTRRHIHSHTVCLVFCPCLRFSLFFFSHLNMNNVTWFFMLLKYYSFSQTQHFEIIEHVFRICRNSRLSHVEV